MSQSSTDKPRRGGGRFRKIFGVVIGGFVLGIIGLMIGSDYGGNYAQDFQFAGNRGYEATGVLGAIIGSILGCILGGIWGWLRRKT